MAYLKPKPPGPEQICPDCLIDHRRYYNDILAMAEAMEADIKQHDAAWANLSREEQTARAKRAAAELGGD